MKYEQVIFCGLSDFQLSLYRLFISSPEIKALLRGADSQPLKAINILKKLCNHPELLDLPKDLQGCEKLIPEGFCGAGENNNGVKSKRGHEGVRCDWGGKFVVLERCVLDGRGNLRVLIVRGLPDSSIVSGLRQTTRSSSSAITLKL